MVDKKIFWISSYPKSGNTWMRAIISSIFFTNDGKFIFDYFKYVQSFDLDKRFEFVKKINRTDYNKLHKLETLAKYWIEGQKNIVIDGDFQFLKTHHSCVKLNNYPFTSSTITMGAIYLIRDPRDIVLSYSNHLGQSIDRTIELMVNKETTAPYVGEKKLKIYLSSWNVHVNSWQNINIPVLLIRYEDLLTDTKNIIIELVNFFEKNFKIKFRNIKNKLENILETTHFDKFKNYEKKYGFAEASRYTNFFRKGKIYQWRNKLTNKQIKTIEDAFGNTMKRFKYL